MKKNLILNTISMLVISSAGHKRFCHFDKKFFIIIFVLHNFFFWCVEVRNVEMPKTQGRKNFLFLFFRSRENLWIRWEFKKKLIKFFFRIFTGISRCFHVANCENEKKGGCDPGGYDSNKFLTSEDVPFGCLVRREKKFYGFQD